MFKSTLFQTLMLFFIVSISFGGQKAGWIADSKTGCQVWNLNPQPNESVSWSGQCISGKAQGEGSLIWFENGFRTWKTIYSKERGVVMENGHSNVTIDQSAMKFSMKKCSNHSYRAVRADVDKSLDLANSTVAKYILGKAGHFAQKNCPKQNPTENVDVVLYQNGQKIVDARNYDNNKFTWFEYSNAATQKQARLEKDRNRKEKHELKQRRKQEKLAAEKRELERKKNETKKRYDKFSSKNKVKEWPSIEELAANPFIFQKTIIALPAVFLTMQTANQGIFKNNGRAFVVSKIPNGTFRSAKQLIVIAGRVEGKIELNGYHSEDGKVPHLKFVGVYICKDRNCNDIIR